jgi:hypothetical protein
MDFNVTQSPENFDERAYSFVSKGDEVKLTSACFAGNLMIPKDKKEEHDKMIEIMDQKAEEIFKKIRGESRELGPYVKLIII